MMKTLFLRDFIKKKQKGDDAMRVTFINVGYGDAALFQMPGGYTALLDGGGNLEEDFRQSPYRIRGVEYLRAQGISCLDAVILSHIHEDHVCGLEAILSEVPMKRLYVPYPVEPFLEGRTLHPGPGVLGSVPLYTRALNAYRRIICEAAAQGVPIQTLEAGESVLLTPGLQMEVLGPKERNVRRYMERLRQAYMPGQAQETIDARLTELDVSSNETSLLLRFEAERTVFLMAADSCPREWDEVPSFLLENVNVLKLPHHGQIDSFSEHYMRNMPLAYVVTTSASDRRNNSAHPQVYQRLSDMRPQGEKPVFLFTDEREYSPYFSQASGFQAVTLAVNSGKISVEFIQIQKKENDL